MESFVHESVMLRETLAAIAPRSGGVYADATAGGGGHSEALLQASAPDGRVVFGPIKTSGIYTVSWKGLAGPQDAEIGGRSVRPFAANLLDPAESNIGTVEKLELASRIVGAESGGPTKSTRRLWPWLALAALGVIMFEWFVYNRKVQL